MAIIYGDEPRGKFSGTPISLWETPAVMGAWKKHLENFYFLKLIYVKGTVAEKGQAAKELKICERKIAFWESHPEFDKQIAASTNAKMKSAWKA